MALDPKNCSAIEVYPLMEPEPFTWLTATLIEERVQWGPLGLLPTRIPRKPSPLTGRELAGETPAATRLTTWSWCF
jgi:hypothetical protein